MTPEEQAEWLAVYQRAADECPSDLTEWGREHGIPTFAKYTWEAGFVAGWRRAVTSKPIPPAFSLPTPEEQDARDEQRLVEKVVAAFRKFRDQALPGDTLTLNITVAMRASREIQLVENGHGE